MFLNEKTCCGERVDLHASCCGLWINISGALGPDLFDFRPFRQLDASSVAMSHDARTQHSQFDPQPRTSGARVGWCRKRREAEPHYLTSVPRHHCGHPKPQLASSHASSGAAHWRFPKQGLECYWSLPKHFKQIKQALKSTSNSFKSPNREKLKNITAPPRPRAFMGTGGTDGGSDLQPLRRRAWHPGCHHRPRRRQRGFGEPGQGQGV